MLVLSRRSHDKIVFPNLGITIQVIRIDGKTVRLGIDAPRDVPVLRHELAEKPEPVRETVQQRMRTLRHSMRNRLNAATIGLHLLQRQLENGRPESADSTILTIMRELEELEQDIGQARPSGTGLVVHPRRALLVDDNENESELLAAYLRSCDIEVDRARDGADALEYLAGHEKPDVILMDMTMPRMDGPATICEIRSNPANAGLKIFAVTGMSPQEAGVSIGEKGVNRWFTKPIRPDLLVNEIDLQLVEPACAG